MICRLCLKENAAVIDIFGEIGIELNVAIVLGKYFWFEPQSDDPISTAICNPCWISVSNFNEFYLNVEEAHRLLTERFSFNNERAKSHKTLKKPNEVECVEAPFASTLPANPCDVKLPSDVLKCEAAAGDDDELDLQIKSFFDCNENHEKAAIVPNQIASDETKPKCETVWEVDSFSLGSETLMEETLANVMADDGEDALALPKERSRRITRFSAALTAQLPSSASPVDTKSESIPANTCNKDEHSNDTTQAQSETKFNATAGIKKRRGRPPKNKTSEHNNTKSTIKMKAKTEPDDDMTSYEKRMQLVDEKIAKCVRLICDICTKEESTFLQLRKHMEHAHQVKGYIKCCNKKFQKRALLMEHVEKHLNPDCYKCLVCDKSFADKQCMRNHILIKHQPEEAKTYQCERCPKRFARPYILEQHRMIHEARTHICDICQRGFASSNMLATHTRAKHSNYGSTMCDICAKVIRGRTAFARHQLEHSGVVLPKVQCDKCGSWHKDKYSLQKHKRRHNDDGAQFVCNICGKNSPNRSALLSHQRYVHKAQRNFECSVCHKAFKKAINLKEHMTLHTGEVLYRCPHCPKTFNSNANMHSHRKKMHRKEFEEARQLRHSNVPTKPIIKQKWSKRTQDLLEDYVKEENSTDESSIPQMITIKSDDGQETHKILVTTDDFSDNEVEMTTGQDSIMFTVN